jgi:hypothetical protein
VSLSRAVDNGLVRLAGRGRGAEGRFLELGGGGIGLVGFLCEENYAAVRGGLDADSLARETLGGGIWRVRGRGGVKATLSATMPSYWRN